MCRPRRPDTTLAPSLHAIRRPTACASWPMSESLFHRRSLVDDKPINTDYGFGYTNPFDVDPCFDRYFAFRIGERALIGYRNQMATIIGQIRLYDMPCYFLTPDDKMFDNGIYPETALKKPRV